MARAAMDGGTQTQSGRAVKVAAALWILYLCATVVIRAYPSLRPWVAETDWKQWLWIYHRFSTPGAFPPGQLLTDYAFVVQPPAYLGAAAGLSALCGSPVVAATILYAIALAAAIVCAWWAASARVHRVVALWPALVIAHDFAFFKHTVGGYPRSFGPALTLLFLAAWMHRRHKLVLFSLVLMAALYPSVVVPCGLAYGAWSVALAGREGFWRRNLALAGVGVIVAVLSQLQSLRAPAWWGSVVTLAEAEAMPALGPEGRTPWVPMPGYWEKVVAYATQPFKDNGYMPVFGLAPWATLSHWIVLGLALAAVVFLVVRARRAGEAWRGTFSFVPLEPALLVGASLVAYLLARVLAFRLYLPHRVVQHVLPYAMAILVVLVLARAVIALAPRVSRGVESAAIWGPFVFLLVAGDGLLPRGLRGYEEDAPLYTWVEQHTPVDAQLAGNLKVLDELPFFSKRQAYVNWKMAHPFRKGFYAEIERRVLAMYDAFYASEVEQVLAFAEREKVTHFVVDTSLYAWVEQGDGQLFEPLRSSVVKLWRERRRTGFVFLGLPEELIAFKHGAYIVVSVDALKTWRAAHPTATPRQTVSERIRSQSDVPLRSEEAD